MGIYVVRLGILRTTIYAAAAEMCDRRLIGGQVIQFVLLGGFVLNPGEDGGYADKEEGVSVCTVLLLVGYLTK